MAFIDEFKAKVPWARDMDNDSLVSYLAERTGKPRDVVAEDFELYNPKKSRNPLAVANDLAIEFGNAVAGGLKAGSDFVAPGNAVSRGLQGFIDSGEQSQSYYAQRQKRGLSEALQTDEFLPQAKAVGSYIASNPGLSAAQALGSFVGPGAAIKGARGLAGLGRYASKEAAEQAAKRAGVFAASGVGGVLSGGDAAGNAYDLVMNSRELASLPYEEREQMALDAARTASIAPFLYGAATGRFGAEGALARNSSKGILRTAAGEALQETGDEGISAYSGRKAASMYDPTINPMEGVYGQGMMGGALGGFSGGAVGALTRPRAAQELNDKSKPADLLNDTTPYPASPFRTDQMRATPEDAERFVDAGNALFDRSTGQAVQLPLYGNLPYGYTPDMLPGAPPPSNADWLPIDYNFPMPQGGGMSPTQYVGGDGQPLSPNALVDPAYLEMQRKAAEAAAKKASKTKTEPKQAELGFVETPNAKAITDVRAQAGNALSAAIPGISPQKKRSMLDMLIKQNGLTSVDEVVAQLEQDVDAAVDDWQRAEATTPTKTGEMSKRGQEAANRLAWLQQLRGDKERPTLQQYAEGKRTLQETIELQEQEKRSKLDEQRARTGTGNFADSAIAGTPRRRSEVATQEPLPPGEAGFRLTAPTNNIFDQRPLEVTESQQAPSQREINKDFADRQGKLFATRSKQQAKPEQKAGKAQAYVGKEAPVTGRQRGLTEEDRVAALEETTNTTSMQDELAAQGAEFEESMNVREAGKGETTLAGAGNTRPLPSVSQLLKMNVNGLKPTVTSDVDEKGNAITTLDADKLNNFVEDVQTYLRRDNLGKEERTSLEAKLKDALAIAQPKGQKSFEERVAEARRKNQEKRAKQNAVQERSAAPVDAQEQAGDGQAVGSRDAAREAPAGSRTEEDGQRGASKPAETPAASEAESAAKTEAAAKPAKAEEAARAEVTETSATRREQLEQKEREAIQKTAAEVAAEERKKAAKAKKEPAKSKAAPVPKPVIRVGETTQEAAAREWNARKPEAFPSFDQIPAAAQREFIDGGVANWTAEDVALVAKKYSGPAPAAKEQSKKSVDDAAVQREVDRLSNDEKRRLAAVYGEAQGTAKFLARVKEDVIAYANKGVQAVDAAIRTIIKKIAEGVMAVAVVFNPAAIQGDPSFTLPKRFESTTTVTTEVRATVPAAARNKMSTDAAVVYETVAPTMAREGKGFMIADKKDGTLHVFRSDGSVIAQTSALYGKDFGDQMQKIGNEWNRVTPAGRYTLSVADDPAYKSGKIFRLTETYADNAYVAVHAVYLGTPAEQRIARLASKDPTAKRISYGCINTSNETFLNDLLPNSAELNGGAIFVLPEESQATAMFTPEVKTETTTTVSQESTADNEGRQGSPADRRDPLKRGTTTVATRRREGRSVSGPRANNFLAPDKYFYHAVRSVEDIPGILREGLRPGTNLSSSTDGQAFVEEGATVLVFRKEDVRARRKGYQDDHIVQNRPRPVGVLKDTSIEVFAGNNKKEEAFNKRWDALEARKNNYATTLGVSREEFDSQMWSAAGSRSKPADFSWFGEYADSVKEMELEERRLHNISEVLVRDMDRPVVTAAQVLEQYAQYGLPVEPFRVNVNERTGKIDVTYAWPSGRSLSTSESLEKTTNRTNRQVLLKVLEAFTRKGRLPPWIHAVQSLDEIPADVIDGVEAASGPVSATTQGFVHQGQVWLIADNISRGAEQAVFMHEVGSHIALEGMLSDKQFETLVDQILAWSEQEGNSLEKRLAVKAMERVFAADTKDEQRNAEMIAYFIEEATAAGIKPSAKELENASRSPIARWLRKVFQFFERALDKLNLRPETLTTKDIVDLAYGAAQKQLDMLIAGDTGQSLRSQAAAKPEADLLPKPAQKAYRYTVDKLQDWASAGLDRMVFTNDLVSRAVKAGLKSAETFGNVINERNAAARALERKAESIADMYADVEPQHQGDGAGSVNDFLKESTRARKWGYGQFADPEMAKRFNALGPKAQAFVKAVFAHGDAILAQKKQTVMDYTETEYDSRIRQAKAEGNAGLATKLEREKQAEVVKFRRLFAIQEGKPYAPLRRFGNWAVVAKSQEYLEAEANENWDRVRELETDADHYRVSFVESKSDARALAAVLSNKFETEFFERDKVATNSGSLLDAFTKLRSQLTALAKDGDEGAAKLRDLVAEMYLETLAESSARKSEMRFRGIAGDIDVLRSFAHQGQADAHFMASVKYSQQLQDAIEAMRKEQRGGDRARKSEIFNELNKRYQLSLERVDTPWTNKLTRLTSIWFLATSPAYYLQNLAQPWMMTVPYLAQRHGYGESHAEMLRAYRELKPVLTGSKALKQSFDLTKVPEDVRAAIERLANLGRIEIGLDSEMGEFRVGGRGPIRDTVNKIDKGLRLALQKVESINRLSSAIAAYRMELKKTGSEQAATDYAAKVLNETHGDYTRFNAPRVFNSNAGRVMLQFRKFQLIQLSYYVKMINDSFTNPAERAAALRGLAFSLGHTALLAGVNGLPGFAALAFVAGLFGGDDDKKFNLEMEIRKMVGPEWADLVTRGAPTLLGADVSGKVGAGNMLSILPFSNADLTTTRGRYEALGTLVAGPSGAMAMRQLDGLGLMASGDYLRGLGMMLPKGFGDVVNAARESDQGMTRRNGDVLMTPEDITFWDTSLRAVGVMPVKQSVVYAKQDAVRDQDEQFQSRAKAIKASYVRAVKDGDTRAAAEAREAWAKLQASRAELGYPRQPLSELLTAPAEARKREKNTSGGVQFNKSNRRFVESLV